MGFGGSIDHLQKSVIPKELRNVVPKEVQPGYASVGTDKLLGLGPKPPPDIPGIPPPESIDIDAYRLRDRMRRRARAGGGTVRTSSAGAPYSAAPKSLLGS